MQRIDITRTGSAAVAEQLAEMEEWLQSEGIEPASLEPVSILRGRVRFRAVFATEDAADRFQRRFDEAEADTGHLA